jgi:hypothetical protein
MLFDYMKCWKFYEMDILFKNQCYGFLQSSTIYVMVFDTLK